MNEVKPTILDGSMHKIQFNNDVHTCLTFFEGRFQPSWRTKEEATRLLNIDDPTGIGYLDPFFSREAINEALKIFKNRFFSSLNNQS